MSPKIGLCSRPTLKSLRVDAVADRMTSSLATKQRKPKQFLEHKEEPRSFRPDASDDVINTERIEQSSTTPPAKDMPSNELLKLPLLCLCSFLFEAHQLELAEQKRKKTAASSISRSSPIFISIMISISLVLENQHDTCATDSAFYQPKLQQQKPFLALFCQRARLCLRRLCVPKGNARPNSSASHTHKHRHTNIFRLLFTETRSGSLRDILSSQQSNLESQL